MCSFTRQVGVTPWFSRQGQAHIVSTAIVLPGSRTAIREVEATPWFLTSFSIDPQPVSISPTVNISIVFICTFFVDCGRIIRHPAIKNDSSAIPEPTEWQNIGIINAPPILARANLVNVLIG